MHCRFLRLVFVLTCLAAAALSARRGESQQPGLLGPLAPRLFLVLPSGGQVGSTFEMVVSGQDLDQAQGLLFSQPGITAESLGPTTPPAIDPKAKPLPKGALANSHKFRVTVPAGTKVGIHDVRVVTAHGVSNPRAFVAGDLKEFVEREPNNNVDQMQRVELNSTISGIIASPTDVDYFVFSGKKGQRVVVSCLTTSIDSKLPATIELYSLDGSYLGFNRNYHHNDALLDADLPADGDYYVRVSSFAYTLGGPDYFYRLTISTAPWIDAVFPPVVEPGTKAAVTIYGRNLPGGKLDPSAVIEGRTLEKLNVTIDVPKDARKIRELDIHDFVAPLSSGLDGFEYRVRNETGWSNAALLTFAQAPVVLDAGDHNEPEKAQKVTLPCEIAGRIEKKGDRDWYSFTAKKGEVYSIEVYGDRLGSPVDMYFVLRTPEGKILKEDDDNPEIFSPQFYTPSTDPPRYRFVVPADGTYQLLVSSRFAYIQSGPRHNYRVRITAERPDFRVVVMSPATGSPDTPLVRQGGNQVLTVYVWRQDGFNSPITISGENLPPGIKVQPQIVMPAQKQALVVVSAEADAKPWAGAITLVATATIDGQQVVRAVRSATVTWPVPAVNVPAISRLDHSLAVAVIDKGPFNLIAMDDKITVQQGDKFQIQLKLERYAKDFTQTVQVVPLNLPTNTPPQPVAMPAGKDTLTLVYDTKGVAPGGLQPGTYTWVFRAQATIVGAKGGVPKKANILVTAASSPVTVTIVPKEVGKVAVGNQTPTVKVGGKVEVPITVARLYDYGGDFKMELILPPGTKGISAEAATIPASQDTGKLVITAAPDATLGVRSNLTVRLTAMVSGHPVTQEKKLNVNVVK
jgi:hypothetical protein